MKKIMYKHAKQIHSKFKDLKGRKHEMLDYLKIPSLSQIRNSMFDDKGVLTMPLENIDPTLMNRFRLVVEQSGEKLVSFNIIPTVIWNFDPVLNKELEEIMETTVFQILDKLDHRV